MTFNVCRQSCQLFGLVGTKRWHEVLSRVSKQTARSANYIVINVRIMNRSVGLLCKSTFLQHKTTCSCLWFTIRG